MNALKKLVAVAFAAIAAFAMSAFQSIAAHTNCYMRFSSNMTGTGAITDSAVTVNAINGITSGSGQSAGCTVQTTLRRAITTRELAANNSISNRQFSFA